MSATHHRRREMGDPRIELVHRFFSGTGPTYDSIVNLCTFGFDRLWKKRMLDRFPERPMRLIDHACGTGILTFKIARQFPDCHVIAVELRDEYLEIARQKAKSMGINNVEFLLSRAEDVLLEGPFDCITASYLAKYADLITLTRKTKKMLRKGGVFLMHDFTYPSNRAFAWIWGLYFSLLQKVGTLWYPQWRTIYYELPELIRKTNWVTELVELLKKEGFSEITIDTLTFETSALVMGRK